MEVTPDLGCETNASISKLAEICASLDIKDELAHRIAAAYESIESRFGLEGRSGAWISAAIYIYCNFTFADSRDPQGCSVSIPKISVYKILKKCNANLLEFFDHLKKWLQMSGERDELRRERILRVENRFAVSAVIFKKFRLLFVDIFGAVSAPTENTPAKPLTRSGMRKAAKQNESNELAARDVFDFAWTLFSYLKGSFPRVSDDLVNSVHLLIVCLDFCYGSLLEIHRGDLISPRLSGLLPTTLHTNPQHSYIIDYVAQQKNIGVGVEAKRIRVYWLQPKLKALFERKVLSSTTPLTGYFLAENFMKNLKELEILYARQVLQQDIMDERIFLASDQGASEIGTPSKSGSTTRPNGTGGVVDTEYLLRKSVQACLDRVKSKTPQTPLSGSYYYLALGKRQPNPAVGDPVVQGDTGSPLFPITPVSMATHTLAKLQHMLTRCSPKPSAFLLRIFSECTENPHPIIELKLVDMQRALLAAGEAAAKKGDEAEGLGSLSESLLRDRLQMSLALFYRILDRILTLEKARLPPGQDFSELLCQDTLYRSLFACCVDVVLFVFNLFGSFTHILEALRLPAYHFYKIIELFIRADPDFSRDIIKHLNSVEETVLEELVWLADSPLWEAIEKEGSVPACEEVMLKEQLAPRNLQNVLPTPLGASGRFEPAQTGFVVGSAKRKLDFGGGSGALAAPQGPPAKLLALQDIMRVDPAPIPAISLPSRAGDATARDNNDLLPQGIDLPANLPVPEILSSNLEEEAYYGRPALGDVCPRGVVVEEGVGEVVTPMDTSSPEPVAVEAMAEEPPGSTVEAPPVVTEGSELVAANEPPKPARKVGSYVLFFRKIYTIAHLRLKDLSDRLGLSQKVRQVVWTLFEHVLKDQTSLLKNRHLDQILICCCYVISKIAQSEKPFQEILRRYRMQPQARSRVYRNVLLDSTCSSTVDDRCVTPSGSLSSESGSGSSSVLPAPSKLRSPEKLPPPALNSPPASPKIPIKSDELETPAGAQRGSIVSFYNELFVPQVEDFMRKINAASLCPGALISAEREYCGVPLSPLPAPRSLPSSPRRQVASGFYLSPMKPNFMMPTSPMRPLRYNFCRSPAKDLKAINEMLRDSANRSMLPVRAKSFEGPTSSSAPAGNPQSMESIGRVLSGLESAGAGHPDDDFCLAPSGIGPAPIFQDRSHVTNSIGARPAILRQFPVAPEDVPLLNHCILEDEELLSSNSRSSSALGEDSMSSASSHLTSEISIDDEINPLGLHRDRMDF